MNTTTGIRIEVPQDLYKKMQEEQEKRTVVTGKKPALSAIILEFCSEKLDTCEDVHSDVHSVHESVQKSVHPNSSIDKKDSNAEKRLQQWDERLSKWEKSLLERDKMIKDQEKEIFQEKLDALELKSMVLDERDKLHQKALDGTEMVVDMRLLKNDLKHKDEVINQLSKELSFIKDKLLSRMKDHKKGEPKTLLEQFMGFLPWIAGGLALISIYLLATKDNKPALPKELLELAGVFDGLSENDQKALGEKLKYYADKHTDPADANKMLQLSISQSKKD
jgi:hypothetical protein